MACRNLQLADMIAADAARTQARGDLRALPVHQPCPLREKPHLHPPFPVLHQRIQLALNLIGDPPPDEQNPEGQELPV